MTDFLTEYEALAYELAKAARGAPDAPVALGDKIDALKALTPFYVHKMKNMKPVGDADDFPTFDNFQRDIHKTEN